MIIDLELSAPRLRAQSKNDRSRVACTSSFATMDYDRPVLRIRRRHRYYSTWSTVMRPVTALLIGVCIGAVFTVLTFAGCGLLSPNPSVRSDMNIAYDQMISTGRIRAGYVVYPPGCFVDPDSNEVVGIFPDILREIAKNAALEIEFVEEVGFGTMIEGLQTRRYHMLGSPVWGNTSRAKLTMMSDPVHFTAIGVWVRPSETRFTPKNDWECFNDSSIRIAAMDGSIPLAIATAQFPEATLVTYPDLAGTSQLLMDVAEGKADVLFTEQEKGLEFLKSHPRALVNIAKDRPIRVFPSLFMLRKNEPQLKNMIDVGIAELQNSRFIDQTLRKYEPFPGVYPRRTPSFSTEE